MRMDEAGIKSCKQWLGNILCGLADLRYDNITWIACLLWWICKERNEMIFNYKTPDPSAVLLRSTLAVKEFLTSIIAKDLEVEAPLVQEEEKWQAPPRGQIKINCDGSFLPKDNSAAVGLIGRNCEGDFLWGFSESGKAISAFDAELQAVRKAILISEELDIGQPIIETDSRDLYLSLKNLVPTNCEWRCWHLLMEVLDLAKSRLSLSFSFSRREGNTAADFLAVSQRKGVWPTGWVSTPPPPLLTLISRDRASIDSSRVTSGEHLQPQDREGVG